MTDLEIRAIAAQLAFDVGITREEAERIVREELAKGANGVEFSQSRGRTPRP